MEVLVDTSKFVGQRSQTLYVTLKGENQFDEVRLLISANSREDLAFFPPTLDFTKIQRGTTGMTQMIVTYPAQAKVHVTGAKCASDHIDVELHELERGTTQRSYQLIATVRASLPEGELYTHVELTTSNPAMPRLRVPLRVEVEAPAPRK